MRHLVTAILLACSPTYAETWWSFTLDNDVFVGRDHGYSNGLYLAHHNVGSARIQENPPKPGLLASVMRWSIDDTNPTFSVNSHTLGQVMITPKDISTRIPDPNDLPYSGTLFLDNTYIAAQADRADKISVTVGVVGPTCRAGEAQLLLHKWTDSTTPQGWDTQLEDEYVFQLERSRIWRKWLDRQGQRKIDMVYSLEASAGLIKILTSSSVLWRWGTKLDYTYVTSAFSSTRTSNPVATEGGWFVYGGFKASYIARQIHTDGNAFRESLSTELDHTQLGATMGLTHSWRRWSVSLAVEKLHLFEHAYESTSEYGTLTIAWKQN